MFNLIFFLKTYSIYETFWKSNIVFLTLKTLSFWETKQAFKIGSSQIIAANYFWNHKQRLTFTIGLYCKYINSYIIYSGNSIIVFSSCIMHSVSIKKNSVFFGEYFFTLQMINQFFCLFRRTKLVLNWTNNLKTVNFF